MDFDWGIVSLTDTRRQPPRRVTIALAAGLCLLAAVIGVWLVQSESAVPTLSRAVPTASVSAVHTGHEHLGQGSAPALHRLSGTTGPQHQLPPTGSQSLSASYWAPLPDSPDSPDFVPTLWYRLGKVHHAAPATARAPATVLSGHEILTRICIDRR